MRSPLAYSPRPEPLGGARPSVAAIFLLPPAFAAFTFSSPVVICAAALASVLVAWRAGALGAALAPLRYAVPLAVTMIVVNGIVSQRGETILFRGGELPLLGRIDITAEALAEGGVLALRVLAAILVFAVWSACVDPDRILRALRPFAARSSLTASLITRLVPLAAADLGRLSDAAKLRGPGAAPAGRASLMRRVVAGSLDRSVDVAATLELRGYGLGIRPPRERSRLTRGEWRLLVAGAAMLALLVYGLIAGIGEFEAYPEVTLDFGLSTIALAAALPLISLLPMLGSKGRERR